MKHLLKFLDSLQFWADYYEKAPLHLTLHEIQGPDASDCLKTLGKNDFDTYLSRRLKSSLLRIAKNGANISLSEYTLKEDKAPAYQGTKSEDLEIDIQKVLSLYAFGATLILQKMETMAPQFLQMIRGLESRFFWKIQANAYLTPKNSQGFSAHFDEHDALILQIYGEKDWTVYQKISPFPEVAFPIEQPTESLWEGRLVPGDILYIPSGFPHEAATSSSSSGHITLAIFPPKISDYYRFLVDSVSRENAKLRKGFSSSLQGNSCESLSEITKIFVEKMADEPWRSQVFQNFRQQWLLKQKPATVGSFLSLEALSELSEATVFTVNKAIAFEVDKANGKVNLVFNKGLIPFPPSLEPMVNFMRDHESFRVKDLPGGLTIEHLKPILTKLVTDGFLLIEEQV